MSPRALGAALIATAGMALAPACESDPPASGCPDFCDDGDPCTEDRCDPATLKCIFIPLDAAHACLYDWHCDDHIDCTVDSCRADPACGFQRCAHDPAPGCQGCSDASECSDGDPCSLDACTQGFCAHDLTSDCEPRCGESFDMPDGVARIFGTPLTSACACPCSTALTLLGDGGVTTAIDIDAGATCDLTCDPDGGALADCRPLAARERWAVWGTLDGHTLSPDGWCLAPDAPMPQGELSGALDLGDLGRAVLHLTRVTDASPELMNLVTTFDDPNRPLDIFLNDSVMQVVEGLGRRLSLAVVSSIGVFRTFDVLVFPSATGFVGRARSNDGLDPIDAPLRLELTPGPR
ncbi:MAG: hypothetical protein U1F43_08185 [Myxococcota bacterium]